MKKIIHDYFYNIFFVFYFIFKTFIKFISIFIKKQKDSEIYFLSGTSPSANIRLIKIARALNVKNKKPILIIPKHDNNYTQDARLFKNIIYFNGFYDLAIITLKIGSNPIHAFTEGTLKEIFISNICKFDKFFFDNYDQVSEIVSNNLKSIIEKLIIYNSINVCRSIEINLLKKKKINHIFFTDYISELNTSHKELKKKSKRKTIKVCYVGKIKESDNWQNLNSYDPNMNETILWFSKFKNISLHIFPSYLLSQNSRKKYASLCKPYKNIFFNKTSDHNTMLKKIKNFDCGIVVFPIVNWPNKIAQKKYVYAMGNKIFDYLSSGLISIFPFHNKKKVMWFMAKLLEKHKAACYIDTTWNEEKIFNKLKIQQKKLNIKNIERNLISKHIDRLLSKYFND